MEPYQTKRAAVGSPTLLPNDIAEVKGMLIRGDRQSDIAAWYGVNIGRINEINKKVMHLSIPPLDAKLLPPADIVAMPKRRLYGGR